MAQKLTQLESLKSGDGGGTFDDMEHRVAFPEQSFGKMDAKLGTLVSDVSSLKGDVSSLKGDLSSLKEDTSYLKGKMEDISYVRGKMEDLSYLKGKVDNLPTTICLGLLWRCWQWRVWLNTLRLDRKSPIAIS